MGIPKMSVPKMTIHKMAKTAILAVSAKMAILAILAGIYKGCCSKNGRFPYGHFGHKTAILETILVGNGHFGNNSYWKRPLWRRASLKTAMLEHGHFDTPPILVTAILGTIILGIAVFEMAFMARKQGRCHHRRWGVMHPHLQIVGRLEARAVPQI